MSSNPLRLLPAFRKKLLAARRRWTLKLSWPNGYLALTIAVVAVFILGPTAAVLINQRISIADSTDEIATESTHLAKLQRSLDQWNDPDHVESQARDRLFYAMPGETLYLVVDNRPENDKPKELPPISSDLTRTEPDWAETLLGDVFDAGLAPEETAPPAG
ncbi:septum formation initiator family protein [Agromyces sp. NPDC057679]|uniref:FtsB family cell division protein n=1 Tax=Agromyces sp. NPDC057679 TaxID=3346207 RepID=UPI00366B84E6